MSHARFAIPAAVPVAIVAALLCAPAAEAMEISFAWSRTDKCSKRSPEIQVTSIPQGTTEFQVRLKDLDKPAYPHGGGTVANDGSGRIARGALDRYEGPCPPFGQVHDYQFTVKAMGGGVPLATATAEDRCCN